MGIFDDIFGGNSGRETGEVPKYLRDRYGISDNVGVSSSESSKKWVCPRCGTTNWMSNYKCSRCGNLNPYDD